MGNTTYEHWKARLNGERVLTFDGDPDVGFYRKPIRSSRQDGNKIIGWEPVAYFMNGDKMAGAIGDRDMTETEVTDLWTYVCAYPIPEQVYFDVADRGQPWPEGLIGEPKNGNGRRKVAAGQRLHESIMDAENRRAGELIPTATEGRTVTSTDNAPPEAIPRDQELSEQIKNAKKAAEQFKNNDISSDAEAEKAAGARNRLNELKGEAEREKEVEYRPLKTAADKVTKKWNPIITEADDEAKAIYRKMLRWEQKKRDDAAAAAKKAAEEQAKLDEANRRAADRAIAGGQEPPAPQVVETPAVPPPVATVRSSYGRAVPIREKTFVVIQDLDLVYSHFKGRTEVIDLLTTLAQREIDAGLSVPGTTTRTGVI